MEKLRNNIQNFKRINGEPIHEMWLRGIIRVEPNGGSRPSYQRLGENQGWTKDRDGGWRDRERDWCDKDHYVPPHDLPKPKEPNADPESFQTKDRLAHILNKVEESDKLLMEMKADFSDLNQTVTSHSVSIKQFETQMAHLNPRPKGNLPSDTIENSKNENAQCMVIVTQRGRVIESNASSSKWKAIVLENDALAEELNK
ncbi:hypothetical protein MTR67_018717 [Solanum verrucosum]|uniref:Integrase core domain containing protein n=1 Tax=Solanum verrucosum TaxID=315347 RepID=A0AAF0QK66_SOLVR|nr:hypothetical protein MTR67_018717 [Solanum verrucosum]